jgi:enterochelin esterase family protein
MLSIEGTDVWSEHARSSGLHTARFCREGRRYPLLVVLDAGAYADYVPVPKILDTLIAEKRIQPIVAVLVGNAARAQELTCSPAYADFLATELVPWMRAGAVDAPVCGRRKEGAATNRRFRDALTQRGYAVAYSEFNGNHSYVGWRTDLARGLQALNIGP